jgi:proline iminopeptidase
VEDVVAFKLLIVCVLVVSSASLPGQSVAHSAGMVHTEQVDIGYETFGERSSTIPVIAINGGPGLSHAYMLQNDVWQRIAKNHLVVFYDQRGTGRSQQM